MFNFSMKSFIPQELISYKEQSQVLMVLALAIFFVGELDKFNIKIGSVAFP